MTSCSAEQHAGHTHRHGPGCGHQAVRQSGAAGRENDCPLFDNGTRAKSRRQRYGSSPGPLIFARRLLRKRPAEQKSPGGPLLRQKIVSV